MRITANGQGVAAVGDGVVTINGVVPPELAGVVAGGACVLNRDEIAYQCRVGPETYRLEAFNLVTRTRRPLADRGANTLRADGSGRFATFVPGEGVIDEAGRSWPKASLLDYADGVLVLCPDYQTGVGIELWIDGQLAQSIPNTGPLMSDAVTGPAVLLRSGILAYQNDRGWTVVGGSKPYVRPAYQVAMVPVPLPDGRYVVLEHDATRLYLRHPDDATTGVFVSRSGEHHAMDARLDGDDVVVAWWTGPGCGPGEYRSARVPLAAIGTESLASSIPDPLAPNVPCVHFAGFWWADDTAPGNAAIGSRTYLAPRHQCVIAGEAEILAIPRERRLGLLVYLPGPDDQAIAAIQRAVAFAAEHDLVLFVYDDRRQCRYALIKAACGDARWVLMPQWYVRANASLLDETPAAFARDVIAYAKTFEGHPILPTIRAYGTSNPAVTAPLIVEALNELIAQGALQLPGFLGPLFFAWDRADGAKYVDAIKPAMDLWFKTPATVTDPQTWAAEQFAPAPAALAVTITDYTAGGAPPLDVQARFRVDGGGPGLRVELLIDGKVVDVDDKSVGTLRVQLVEPGEYRLKARVTVGDRKAETGAVRIVRVLPAPPKPEIPGITYPSQPGSGTVEGARKPWQDAAEAARKEE